MNSLERKNKEFYQDNQQKLFPFYILEKKNVFTITFLCKKLCRLLKNLQKKNQLFGQQNNRFCLQKTVNLSEKHQRMTRPKIMISTAHLSLYLTHKLEILVLPG